MNRWTVLGLSAGLALGCAGLLGYGEELASAPLPAHQQVTLTVEAKEETVPEVWLDYELSHRGRFLVGGTLTYLGQPNQIWTIRLNADDPPILGSPVRKTLASTKTPRRASGTIHLVTLPEVAPGERFTVTAILEPAPGTTVERARLIVTD